MSRNRLNELGAVEFESLIQAILKRVIGPGTTTFGAGADGAREATFTGSAPYPSEVECWSGSWVFQVKFHDTGLIGMAKARSVIISETSNELQKLTKKYKRKIDNFILITNVPLSGVHNRGTIDRIENEAFSAYRAKIPHLAIWGADDVNRLLEIYPEVKQQYQHLLASGDLIAELMTHVGRSKSERATSIDLYLRAAFSREENAQLDQAGDVSEKPIPLQNVFFDLDAYVQSTTREAIDRYRAHLGVDATLPIGQDERVSMVRHLVSSSASDRAVIVGGPGEGKSTIGQYLAQIHRATLLGKAEQIALTSDYIPDTPRLPFRVVLKNFAQWMADNTGDAEGGGLDSYLSEQVTRLSARQFAEPDLHEVIKANPTLLVLDGLDEVTDGTVRKRLVGRLAEFIDRCQSGLHGDLQVIATTRPTNYSDQFDPKAFIHFTLHKLQPQHVRSYADKWTIARNLDEDKAWRLRDTIRACLDDAQVKFLMTTPLQVTILILIINSGGTPPRQREALFNEYLEVIYKREKGKGLGIIKTEKELLIGLHRFIGYLLHEEVTSPKNSSARFVRRIYQKLVVDFLRANDPFSRPEKIRQELQAITVDAGERLVLLVESPADMFGFELRSIQEFFAACYLSDTAGDTAQRYLRLAQIVYLPHWRNVALFFAGRVGRVYPGEAANVIEVCREVDRSGPDLFVKRGSEFALELAAERALGPNRVHQRSLLEHGLELFDHIVSPQARRAGIDLVQRLPNEDVHDHIIQILRQRLPKMGSAARCNACYLLAAVAPDSEVLRANLLQLTREGGEEFKYDVLSILAKSDISSPLRVEVILALLASSVSPEEIGTGLGSAGWPTLCQVAADLITSCVPTSALHAFSSAVAVNGFFSARGAMDSVVEMDKSMPLAEFLQTVRIFGGLSLIRSYSSPRLSIAERVLATREVLSGELPESVKSGNICYRGEESGGDWLMWLTHLLLGDVTHQSWMRFVNAMTDNPPSREVEPTWIYMSRFVSPIINLISIDWGKFNKSGLTEISDLAVMFGGAGGYVNWLQALRSVMDALGHLQGPDRRKFVQCGPGVLPDDKRDAALQALNRLVDARLQPIALEWLTDHRIESLSLPDFERWVAWFGQLPSDSPWKRPSAAEYMAKNAVSFQKIKSTSGAGYLNLLTGDKIVALVIQAAVPERGSRDDLRYLLQKLDVDEREWLKVLGHIDDISHAKRRSAMLHLLSLVDDEDGHIAEMACVVITALSFMFGAYSAPKSAIKSRELDEIQARLFNSESKFKRGAAIALFAVRPPRSRKDFKNLCSLLVGATEGEVDEYWAWTLPRSAHLSGESSLWVESITETLQQGVGRRLGSVLVDLLRELLPRQSQSLMKEIARLGLPTVGG